MWIYSLMTITINYPLLFLFPPKIVLKNPFIPTKNTRASENKKQNFNNTTSVVLLSLCINTITAQSGCLDSYIRWRTHKAAISLGKLLRRVTAQDFRMGEPYRVISIVAICDGHDPNWNILVRSEKKSIEIPKVVTSEIGTAQTSTVPRMSPLP